MKRRITWCLALVSFTCAAVGVFSSSAIAEAANNNDTLATTAAVCVVVPVGRNDTSGTLRFTQNGRTVHITGVIKGLSPGKHGFHVHQFGDLSGNKDGKSTGGHYNPENSKHGKPSAKQRHVGDLGNITADIRGVAKVDITDNVISLSGPHSVIGRSILIHAAPDDFGQPTGNAGARIGFGVIGIAKPSGA